MKNTLKKCVKTILTLIMITAGLWHYSGVLAYSPPTANAGTDQYLNAMAYGSSPATVLQGSAYDPNGGTLSYYWSCTGGYLSSPNVLQPVYTAPSNLSSNTSYICTLVATDNYGLSAQDSVTIFINSNNTSNTPVVQTNGATAYTTTSATLNGYLYLNNAVANSVWFQWGLTSNYGSQSVPQNIGYSGSFSQPIGNLIPNTTYHFRALAQQSNGQILYGQDMTFYTNPNYQGTSNNQNPTYSNAISATITKEAVDLSSGNLTWSNYISASPSDILKFQIVIVPSGNQSLTNVIIKDVLPPNLIYDGNLTVSTGSYSGNIISGLKLGSISPSQTVTISYRAQLASAPNFPYSATTLTNSASLQSDQTGLNNAVSSVTITVNKTGVLGAATSVSTGLLTGNFLTDSFFLPLLLVVAGLWFWKSKILHHKKS